MESPKTLLDQLQLEETIQTAVDVHKKAQQAINHFEKVKTQAKALIRAYLTQTGETRGKTDQGSFGLTTPTPTYRVNEEKWQRACQKNTNLANIQARFDEAQRALDEVQRDYLEEVTPTASVYIR
ncbi:MAG: hypothetical protein AAF629_32435 [Chloroflexota bacterium]